MTHLSRIKIAVILFIASYIFGWPAVIGIETVAAYYKSPFIASMGPVVYAISWIPWIAAFLLGGPPALALAKAHVSRIWSKSDERPRRLKLPK